MRAGRGLWALVCLLAAGFSQGSSGTSVQTLWVEAHDLPHLAPEAPFLDVRDLAVGPESIWVLDAAPPFVTRISLPAGRVTRFGPEGRGPGELEYSDFHIRRDQLRADLHLRTVVEE
jgi:hypothetical protein